MSLRLRSILAAAVATLLAVAVLGSAVDVLVARHLHHGLDQTLRTRAVEVAQLAASAPALVTHRARSTRPVGADAGDGRGRRPPRPHRARGRSRSAAACCRARSRRAAIASGRGRYRTIGSADELRVYAAPLADVPARGGGAVLVAASTADVADTIRTLHAVHAARRARRGGGRRRCRRAADARRAAPARAARPGRGEIGRTRRSDAAAARPAPSRRGRAARDDAEHDARRPRARRATPSGASSPTRRTSCARR